MNPAMNYYVLRHEDAGGVFVDGDVDFSPALADHYQVGRNTLPPGTRIELVLDRRAANMESDFFLTSSGAFFVSEALKDVLSRHRTSLDVFPVNARHAGGHPTKKPYFLVHANERVACFDYVNAEYAGKAMVLSRIANHALSADYRIRGITKLRIVESQTAGLDFFFIEGAIWIDPVISKSVLEAAKAVGLELNVEAI